MLELVSMSGFEKKYPGQLPVASSSVLRLHDPCF